MKILKTFSLLISGTILVLGTSCKKDNPNPSTPSTSGNGISSFFQQNLNNATQTFTINAEVAQTITGSKGTVIHFNANSFVTSSGTPVTGNVQIELIEIYDKKDMILLNKQTMGTVWNGLSPLISGGQFNIVAKQNGQKLKLANGMSYSINAPAPNGTTNEMGLFYGTITNDQLTWSQGDSSFVDISQNGYSLFCDSLNWVNLDYFMNNTGPQSKLNVQIPSGISSAETRVFVSVDGSNTLAGIYQFDSGVFTSGEYYKLPIGLNVHFVVINLENNVIKARIIPSTIANNHLEVVNSLNTYNFSELSTLLQNLP
ncbi:hypothetical protein D3C87_33840 [compost metagenome]